MSLASQRTRMVAAARRWLALLLAVVSAMDASAEEPSIATAAELQSQLASKSLTDRDRVDHVVAWIRRATQCAIHATHDKRKAQWREIEAAQKTIQQGSKLPRGVLIELQMALATVARGDAERENGSSSAAVANARTAYRHAISRMKRSAKKIDDQLQQLYRHTPRERREAPWTVQELESLRRYLRVELARVYRRQAESYAAGSSDQVNSLTQALELTTQLVSLPQNAPVVWHARVEQVACLRLLGRRTEAREKLLAWQAQSPPQKFAKKLTIEANELARNPTNNELQSDLWSRDAANHYLAGNLRQAIKAYDRAALRLASGGKKEEAFEAEMTAAAIMQELGERAAARTRLLRLARGQPQHAEASNVHLTAIGWTALLLREKADEAKPSEWANYLALLEEHVQTWPNRPSSQTAHWWLARQRMEQQHWKSAAVHLELIESTSPHHHRAMKALVECYGRQLINADPPLVDEERQVLAGALVERFPSTLENGKALPHDYWHWVGAAHESLRNRHSAIEAYRKWQTADPNNAEAHESLARLLAQSKQPDALREAQQVWYLLERHSKSGGNRWRRARSARIDLLRRVGETEQAEKLERLTQLLHSQQSHELPSRSSSTR